MKPAERDAPSSHKLGSGMGQIRPALAGVLRALDELGTAARTALAQLAEQGREDDPGAGDAWIDQFGSPLGRREHCRACASGAVTGAYKVKRRWLARRSELDAYIAANGAKAPRTLDAPANDTDDAEPTAAEIEAELRRAGLTFAPRCAGGPR